MLNHAVRRLPTHIYHLFHPAHWYTVGAALLLWLGSGLLVPAALLPLSGRIQGLVTIFLGIFIEALPFLLAGVLASSAIHLFVSPDRVRHFSPRSPMLAALAGSLLGLVFPVCECGSVPTARRLLAKGAPLPLGIAFVLAAPQWSLMSYTARITLISVLLAALTLLSISFAPRAGDVTLAAQSPNGSGIALDSPISVTFSRPVDRRSAERAFLLSPMVKGRIEWHDQTLTFIPAEPLRPQTNYRVTIRPGLRDAQGRVNQAMTSWLFQTR